MNLYDFDDPQLAAMVDACESPSLTRELLAEARESNARLMSQLEVLKNSRDCWMVLAVFLLVCFAGLVAVAGRWMR